MKHLHHYLLREVLIAFGAALGVLSIVMLLGNAVKQILGLMVSRQIPAPEILKAVALLMPFVLVFALPIGLLTAVLLVFGRLSADRELMAAKAGGVSLVALVSPVILLGIACSVLAAGLNMEWAPRSRVAFKAMAATPGELKPEQLLTPGQYITDFPNCTIYLGGRDGTAFRDVLLYVFDEKTGVLTKRINAGRAKVNWDIDQRQALFRLFDAQIFFRAIAQNDNIRQVAVESGLPSEQTDDPEWMTFSAGEAEQSVALGGGAVEAGQVKLSEMTFWALRRELKVMRAREIDATPILFHMHRQVSFSFASFVFVLLGIPLGIQAHRRDTSIGLALALLVVMVYFGFLFLGQSLETKAAALPYLIVWIPNLAGTVGGFWLLARVDRGW